jgi:hypothetical protein
MTTQIQALCAALNDAALDAKIWRGDRIYLNGYGKDISAYITFDDALTPADECVGTMGLFQGCALKVFSNANQDRSWIISRAKQIKHGIMVAMVNASIVPGPVCSDWRDVVL